MSSPRERRDSYRWNHGVNFKLDFCVSRDQFMEDLKLMGDALVLDDLSRGVEGSRRPSYSEFEDIGQVIRKLGLEKEFPEYFLQVVGPVED